MNLDLRVPLVLAGVFLQPVKSRRERSKTECASAVGSSFISVCGNGTTVCPPFGCEVDWLWYGRERFVFRFIWIELGGGMLVLLVRARVV